MTTQSLISSVTGALRAAGAGWVDVGVGGVSLRISVPSAASDAAGRVGEDITLHTSLQVREDSLTLYGFPSEDERALFETLLGVSGIGPRLALAMLDRFSPQALSQAVDAEDTRALSTVPGVGRRTASRIVLDLKGKLVFESQDAPAALDPDLIDALTALGYGDSEACEALSATDPAASDEDRIRAALEGLAG